MRRNRAILLAVLFAAQTPAWSRIDPSESAMRWGGMLDVLEARLLLELDSADETARDGLVDRLESLYRDLLREHPDGTDEHDLIRARAWALVDRAGPDRAIELRLTLLIDAYIPIERSLALHELGLLGDHERGETAQRLVQINTRLRGIAEQAVARAALSARVARSASTDAPLERAASDARVRSLANYYAAWSGLTLAAFEDRKPGSDVLGSFGWLLGSSGEPPKLDDLDDASLALEHVARAAIGVARGRQMLGDTVVAAMWLERIRRDEKVSDEIRIQAKNRLTRLHADDGEWGDVQTLIYESSGADDRPPMPTPEARYLVMRALAPDRKGSASAALIVCTLAIGDLVARGEIGHVLELRERYGSLPLDPDGFVGRYAEALDALADAEGSGSPPRYLAAGDGFDRAARSPDSARFPSQRTDSALKRAYCLVKGQRPREAAELAGAILRDSDDPVVIEQARWIRIVALDDGAGDQPSEELRSEVLAYLASYPGTERSRSLAVRHAGTGVINARDAAVSLRGIPDDDPLAIDARRVLARLLYKSWTSQRRPDDDARHEIVAVIKWIWDRQRVVDVPPGKLAAEMDTARIALDVALAANPKLTDLAGTALERAAAIIGRDRSLAGIDPELVLRRVEWLAALGRLDEADGETDRLRVAADARVETAERIILAAAFEQGERGTIDGAADRIILSIGVRIADASIPPAPALIGVETSAVLSRVVQVAARCGPERQGADAIALRYGRVLLERGTPSGQTVRDLTVTAARVGDAELEMLAWSTLLAASRESEPVWWESRYHTLRLLLSRDADAAERAYAQHRVLHPLPGVLPWTRMIDELFVPTRPGAVDAVDSVEAGGAG